MPPRTVAVELNACLYARYDLLGWRTPLLLGGLELEARMPREPEAAEWARVEEGDVPYLREPEGCDAALRHPSSFWGVSGSRLHGVQIDGILVDGLDQLPPHVDRDFVLDHVAMWSGRFIGWLNAGAGAIVAERRGGRGLSRGEASSDVVTAMDPRKRRLRTDFIASAVATPALAQHAATMTNASIEVPVPWAIWDDAEHSVESDPRRAVIDACTAAEAGIESRLPRMSGVRGIVNKAKAYNQRFRSRSLRIGRIRDQLAAPRNQAAHSGREMMRTQSQQALEVAREVLQIVNPGQALAGSRT